MKTPLGPSSIANVMAEGRGESSHRSGAVSARLGAARRSLADGCCWARAWSFLLRFGLGWAAALVMAGLCRAGAGLLVSLCRPWRADSTPPRRRCFCFWPLRRAASPGSRTSGLPMPDCARAFSDSLPRATIEKIARRPEPAQAGRRDPHRHLSGVRRARTGGPGGGLQGRRRRLHPHDAARAHAPDGSGAGAWRHHRPADRRRLCRFLERAAG